ncbi:hypothetical protein Tco_0215230, partial [Tanacetum coccineum]
CVDIVWKLLVHQKINLEANAEINFSFKLASFDFAVDITDDAEGAPMLLTNATLVNPKGITVNQCTSGFHGLNEAGCKPYLGRFVIVFIDDILAYSKSKCMRNMIVILKLLLESLQEGEVVSLSPNEEVQARELTRRRLHGLEQQMERKGVGRIQVSLYLWIEFGSIGRSVWLRPMHQAWVLEWKMRIESHGILSLKFPRSSDNSKEWNSGDDQLRLRWMIYLVVLVDAVESVRDTIGFEYCLASSSGWTKGTYDSDLKDINEGMSPVLWAEIRESSLIGPELVLETVVQS